MISHDFVDAPRLADLPTGGPRLAPAEVIDVEAGVVVVALDVQQVEAQLAILDYEPSRGDRVLVLGDDASGYHLIGVLATARPRPKLRVNYCDKSRVTTISVDSGDLEVLAPQGTVRIVSAAGIDAITPGPINFQSRVAVRMWISDRLGRTLGRLGLTQRCAELQHDQVEIAAAKLQVEAERCALKAQDGSADVESISLTARRVSTQLGTLLSKVENAYHTVAGLWQLTADRTRMVVRGTSHHKAARLYSKADDVKVKADKIHLG